MEPETSTTIESGELEAAVKRFLLDTYFTDVEAELDDDTHLVETGVLDSVSVLQLVDFMEEGWDFLIDPEDLFRLTSVNNIAEVIREKTAEDG